MQNQLHNRRSTDRQPEAASERYARYFIQSGVALFVLGAIAAIAGFLHLDTLMWVFGTMAAIALLVVCIILFKLDQAIHAELRKDDDDNQPPLAPA